MPTVRLALRRIIDFSGQPFFHEPKLTDMHGRRITYPGELDALVQQEALRVPDTSLPG